MPILKQLTGNSNQSKRRSRADLTVEMISAPLGDFRHTMHVGRGGTPLETLHFSAPDQGEPPRESQTKETSPDPKPGLLSRTFRSSKRSQSVNRVDKYENITTLPSAATSLPYLNAESSNKGNQLPKSSSSLMKTLVENKPMNGGAAMATVDAELDETKLGELKDLPPSMPKGGGMKKAESVMSFHIDLGPSMLGDILSVMEKKNWEEDDLGFEEGKGSEEHASPSHIPHIDDDDAEDWAPSRPPRSNYQLQQKVTADPYGPEISESERNNHHTDSCSVSSSGSEKPQYNLHDGDTNSVKYSSSHRDDDFDFMDQEDDEIRV